MASNPRRLRLARAALAAGALLAGAAYADVTIFKQPNFSGERLTVRGETPDLQRSCFHDQASSVVVNSGRWEFCTQPNFRGDCETLGPGQYGTLSPRLLHRVESVRQVDMYVDRGPDRARMASGSIELFAGPGFRGRSLQLDSSAPNLRRSGFDDRALSLVVNEGVWQLCTDPGYEGLCRVYRPGSYAQIDGDFARNISSARLIRGDRWPRG